MRVLNLISFFIISDLSEMISLVPSESWGGFKWVRASARKWGVGPCPAQCVWQGSGFAADQTNAMLATSNGGDKSSRKRKPLRLLGTASFAEKFAIYSRKTRCFFCWLSRNFSPFTQRYSDIPVWGYHYPWRTLRAVETLDAQGARWLNSSLPCTLFPSALRAHTAAYTGKHGGVSPSP